MDYILGKIEIPVEDFYSLPDGVKVYWAKDHKYPLSRTHDSLDRLVRGTDGSIFWPYKFNFYTHWISIQDAKSVLKRAIEEWDEFVTQVTNGTWKKRVIWSCSVMGMSIEDDWRIAYGCVFDGDNIMTYHLYEQIKMRKPKKMTFTKKNSQIYSFTLQGRIETNSVDRAIFEASLRAEREY